MTKKKVSDRVALVISFLILLLFLFWFLYNAGPSSVDFWENIFMASFLSSFYIIKLFPKIKKFVGNFSQKDILLFSVVCIYFLLIIASKIIIMFNLGYIATLKCSSDYCYLGNVTLFSGFLAFVLLLPFFIEKLTQFVLTISALIGLKHVGLIKALFYLNILCQKFYNAQDFYIFRKMSSGLNQYKKRETIMKEEKEVNAIKKENMSYLYDSRKNNISFLIASFFIVSIYLSAQELSKLYASEFFEFSILKIFGIIVIFITINKFIIFLGNFKKEHQTNLFSQQSYFDSLFLLIIVAVFTANSIFFPFTFVEMFWILYLLSYLFDLFSARIVKNFWK